MPGRALLIDKDADFAARLEAVLGRHAFDVETCSTGREGLERAKSTHPGVIILCVELEDTSGYSVCAKIKKDPDLKGIPLVITSEKATQETFDHHKKLKTRAQLYLMKPFDPELLVAELRPHLEGAADVDNGDPSGSDAEMMVGEGVVEIEDIDVENASEDGEGNPETIGDDDAFGDAGAELDEAIASLSDEPPPLPDELGIEGMAGLPQEYDEDDIRTTIGQIPNDLGEPVPVPQSNRSSIDIPQSDLLRRLKEAERARDEAVALERSTQAQLKALAAGASQLPAASHASREALAIKKELNSKEREILALRDSLQQRDRQLLDAKDREAELEEKVVQAEDASSRSDRARVEAESRIAGAEARAEEIDRSSRAKIEELDGQLEEARSYIHQLEGELSESREQAEGLRGDVADRDNWIADRDAWIAERDERIRDLESSLEASRSEAAGLRDDLQAAREEIEGLTARAEGLEKDLEEARGEIDALRGALSDTEDRLARALRRIREDEDIRGKAKQALEITINLLNEAEYSGEGDVDVIAETADGVEGEARE